MSKDKSDSELGNENGEKEFSPTPILIPATHNVDKANPTKNGYRAAAGVVFGALSSFAGLYVGFQIMPFASAVPVVGPILSKLAIAGLFTASAAIGYIVWYRKFYR